jgi:hypothetical protein
MFDAVCHDQIKKISISLSLSINLSFPCVGSLQIPFFKFSVKMNKTIVSKSCYCAAERTQELLFSSSWGVVLVITLPRL